MSDGENLPVNDGGGLLDSFGLIDSLIIDCNDLPNLLFSNKNIQFCQALVGMVQKLSVLRNGVKNDLESRDKRIEEQESVINNLLMEINRKDVEDNGNQDVNPS